MSRHSFCFSYSLQIDSLPIKNKRCIHVLYTTAHTKMLIKSNTKLFISNLKAKDMGDTESRRDKFFIKIVCALHHGDWFNYGDYQYCLLEMTVSSPKSPLLTAHIFATCNKWHTNHLFKLFVPI